MIIRRPANLQQGTWLLLLFLLVGIVCPTACLLWFMNDAAESQSIAARQEVLEAYRGQLRLVRDQVNSLLAIRSREAGYAVRPKHSRRFRAPGEIRSSQFRDHSARRWLSALSLRRLLPRSVTPSWIAPIGGKPKAWRKGTTGRRPSELIW